MNLTRLLFPAILAAALFALTGCDATQSGAGGGQTSDKEENSEVTKGQKETDKQSQGANVDGSKGDGPTIKDDGTVDYPLDYCSNVVKLDTRADVAAEIEHFCRGGKPTVEMLDFRSEIIGLGKDKRTVVKEIAVRELENDETEIVLVWGYYLKIRPFEVKSRPLYQYIAKDLNDGETKMTATTTGESDIDPDHGLHLWHSTLSYDLTVTATDNTVLTNSRTTQYNMYQVRSGDEEMGFGIESLNDENNPDYKRSILINLSFNDGTGYNDGVGGAIVMNLLRIRLWNRGFPKTARKAINDIGEYLATAMFNGLTGSGSQDETSTDSKKKEGDDEN